MTRSREPRAPRPPRRAALALALALGAGAAAAAGWQPADPAHAWAFPGDLHLHPAQRNEWWYVTGLLEAEDAPGRMFGFQLTFFRVGLVAEPPRLASAFAADAAVMAHAAVTDVAAGTHAFSEVLWRAAPLLGGFGPDGDPVLAFAQAPPGTGGRWSMRLEPGGALALAMRDDARGLALELAAAPERPVVLQGPNGYSPKAPAPGYASSYCSITRLATSGTLTAGGRTFRVRGTSWLDREFGSSQLAPGQVGWDWWSLRLADGRDLMLYALRRAGGAVDWRNATLVTADGRVTLLPEEAWSAEALGTWRSAVTGTTYPSGWRIRVPGAGVDVTAAPLVRGAENVSSLVPGLDYWEGPVRLTGPGGQPAGDGYVELTGYGEGSRLPL